MIILLLFAAGCTMPVGKEIYLSHGENISGLYAVYCKNGCITLKFDENYVNKDDDDYCDLIGFISNSSRQENDTLSLYAMAEDGSVFKGSKKTFDSKRLTASFNIDYKGKDISYILICYEGIQYGLDISKQNYPEIFNIEPVTVEKYGNHVYCPDYLFADDEKINKCLIDCIESNGRYQYTDIFICDYQYFAPDNSITVYAHGYADGAVIDNIDFHANSTVGYEGPCFYRDPVTREPYPEISFDTSGLEDPEMYFLKALRYIRQNTDKKELNIYNPVYGRYQLKYNLLTDSLHYEFIFNGRQLADVDANTGEILKYDPWNDIDLLYREWVSEH